jgi:hypothetical protein
MQLELNISSKMHHFHSYIDQRPNFSFVRSRESVNYAVFYVQNLDIIMCRLLDF